MKYSNEAKGFLIKDNDLLIAELVATVAKVLRLHKIMSHVFRQANSDINFR